jgi:hypothetical protein
VEIDAPSLRVRKSGSHHVLFTSSFRTLFLHLGEATMKSAIRFALFAAVAAAIALAAETASAQEVGIRYYTGDQYGFGLDRAYASGRIPTPPYFAIHPPVYYSYPVPRTYGYTPWAYPSYVMTPEIKAPVAPAMFENPHVKPETTSTPKKMKSASHKAAAPQVIDNPYVTNIRSASVTVEVR